MMGIRIDIKRTPIYSELSEDNKVKYFDVKRDKYLHNIDNIYYSCFIVDDSSENKDIDRLISDLLECKKVMMQFHEEVPFRCGLVYESKRHATYGLCLTSKERYDIFIDEFFRNENTPRILIKIRSMPLWTESIEDVLQETLEVLEEVLSYYGLNILCTRENRIDYCYHTNCIQSPRKHFSDRKLESTLVTSMKSYGIQGEIKRFNSKTILTRDYLCFGNRKSQNVFIRMYNKTREVVEQGYKAYFIHTWYSHGLISFYDKYCLEFAFKYQDYYKIHTARLNFYLEYGTSESVKNRILRLLRDKETTRQDIELLANNIMPKVTIIVNIEFETKRKFYYYSDKQINGLSILYRAKLVDDRLHRLFKILDNRKLFLEYIHGSLMKFEKNGKTCPWWRRLQSCKIYGVLSDDKLAREYNKNLNEKLVQRKLINNIASLSIYDKKIDNDFTEDICDIVSNLNDNDTRYNLVDADGCINELESALLMDYKSVKDKKNRLLKNRLINQ